MAEEEWRHAKHFAKLKGLMVTVAPKVLRIPVSCNYSYSGGMNVLCEEGLDEGPSLYARFGTVNLVNTMFFT